MSDPSLLKIQRLESRLLDIEAQVTDARLAAKEAVAAKESAERERDEARAETAAVRKSWSDFADTVRQDEVKALTARVRVLERVLGPFVKLADEQWLAARAVLDASKKAL